MGLTNAEIGRAFAKARARETLLRERGLRGTALIRNVRQTAVQIKDNTQVECKLQFTLPEQEEYDATVVSVVPLIKVGILTSLQPIPVFVNPTDKQDILVDWGPPGALFKAH